MSQPLTILVVEDEADAAEIIDGLLRHYAMHAEHVVTAEEAYQALTTTAYDAVIIDLFLPGMDGLELMRQIRQAPALVQIPGIAVTAYNSSTLKKQAYEAGFDRYFSKPLDPAELVSALSEILGGA